MIRFLVLLLMIAAMTETQAASLSDAFNQGAQFGALFITFNVGNNPKKATAYFKNLHGVVIDSYNITHD